MKSIQNLTFRIWSSCQVFWMPFHFSNRIFLVSSLSITSEIYLWLCLPVFFLRYLYSRKWTCSKIKVEYLGGRFICKTSLCVMWSFCVDPPTHHWKHGKKINKDLALCFSNTCMLHLCPIDPPIVYVFACLHFWCMHNDWQAEALNS